MRLLTLRLALLLAAICSAWAAASASAASKTFVVTSAAAGGPLDQGSLTWAIYQANYAGADINYIHFNIPGQAGEIEITLTEQLYIARPTVLDATTQPGYAGQPRIRINCNGFASGFTIVPPGGGLPGGGGSTVRGFRIINFSSNAITIFGGANSNTVASNYIGFAPSGGGYFKNTSVSPLCRGIGIESSSNVIRGNTISGVHNGITLAGNPSVPCRNNVVEQNFIGTDPAGATKIGNDSDGVFIAGTAHDNLIGPGNVLSGMLSAGVELLDPNTTNNRIFGNIIGLNAAGTAVIGNGELGVLIAAGASNNWIGGPYGVYAGNVISGNTLGGVAIGTGEFPGANGTNNNHVEGNFIGTDGTGTRALGTQNVGVTVQLKAKGNIIRKNVIVGHANHGVYFFDASANATYGNWMGVTIEGSSIANGGFGVYLHNSSNNSVQVPASLVGSGTEQNFFGANRQGNVGQTGTSSGNVVDPSSPPNPTPNPTPGAGTARLLNISTRMRVETGDNVSIAGFIINGSSPKRVVLRGRGPSVGIPGALADPMLHLVRNDGSTSNDDWRSTQEQEIMTAALAPASNADSAIVATLNPGSYTAIMEGKGNTSGIGLLEVYDLDPSSSSVLANISTRGVVRSGENVMIAGFILGSGTNSTRVVVRARGQSLTAAGIANPLNDPTLALVDSNGNVVRENNNWQDDASQGAELVSLGLAPSNNLESSLVAILAPGAYTAIVSDRNGNAGTGLVEAYHVP